MRGLPLLPAAGSSARRLRLAAVAVAVVVALLAVCAGEAAAVHDCETPNDCIRHSATPVCLVGTAEAKSRNVTGVCVECDPNANHKNCQCPPEKYCVGDPNSKSAGSCRGYEKSVLERTCLQSLKGKGLETVEGVNDRVFCGKVEYNSTHQATYVEWEGSCQATKCLVCTTAPAPSLAMTMCEDGRVCVFGSWDYAWIGPFSWVFFFQNPALVELTLGGTIAMAAVVVVILLGFLLTVGCKTHDLCRDIKKTRALAAAGGYRAVSLDE